LAQFATRDDESLIPNEIMLFDIFSKEIAYIIDVSLCRMAYCSFMFLVNAIGW